MAEILSKSIFYDHLESSKEKIYSYLPENPGEIMDNINFENLEEKLNLNNIEVPSN